MDLTLVFDEDNIVHMRSRGVIRKGDRLLVLRDIYRYWYQVGGRISFGESSYEAMKRELEEELHLSGYRIVRPLFLNEHTVFRRHRRNQEFVIYWEIDIEDTDLLERGMTFETIDDDKDIHHEWAWLTKEEILEYGFYPEPILPLMFNPPERFSIISTHEDIFRSGRDMTFNVEEKWLNIRVAAVFMHEGEILTMKDGKAPFSYLPGGRMHFGESFEDAVKREVREEVQIEPHIIRPLRVSENFFESINHPGEATHELCIYFLMETPKELLERGKSFITHEETTDTFLWMERSELEDAYIMPPFLQTEAFDVNGGLELRIDRS